MKKQILLIFFCVPFVIFCQSPFEIDFKITDTLLIKKNYPYATKINVEIIFPGFQDTVFFYLFNNCVSTTPWWNDSIVNYYSSRDENFINLNDYVGLAYLLMDENNEIISGDFPYPSMRNIAKQNSTFTFVNSRLKFVRKRIKEEDIHEHFLAKYEINSSCQKIALYPLFDEHYKKLSKGVYYLHFVYSFNPKAQKGAWFDEISKDSRTFKGRIFSNKVKLIVE